MPVYFVRGSPENHPGRRTPNNERVFPILFAGIKEKIACRRARKDESSPREQWEVLDMSISVDVVECQVGQTAEAGDSRSDKKYNGSGNYQCRRVGFVFPDE